MNYENTKSKIRRVYEQSSQNAEDLEKKSNQNEKVKRDLKSYGTNQFDFNIIRDFSSEWEECEVLKIEVLNNPTRIPFTIFKYGYYEEWRIFINNIPEKFIPYIYSQVEIRSTTNTDLNTAPQGQSFSPIYNGTIIQKISENNGIYNIVLVIGFNTDLFKEEQRLQGRVIVKITNPQDVLV
jgi:hypothetical protein